MIPCAQLETARFPLGRQNADDMEGGPAGNADPPRSIWWILTVVQFELTDTALEAIEADVAIAFVYHSGDGEPPAIDYWNSLSGDLAGELAARREFRGADKTSVVIHRPAGMKAARLVLAGYGDPDKASMARLRQCTGAVWRGLRGSGAKHVAVLLPWGCDADTGVRAVAEGIALADYEPDVHKSSDTKPSSLRTVTVSAPGARQGCLDRAAATGRARNVARELGNEPGNLLPPRVLADRAAKLVAEAGLDCEVLDQQRMRSLGMGALLGVAQGSRQEPVMIVVRYRPDSPAGEGGTHLGLIGKAVTFDTGGISIKPSADMHLMKHDMCGGAAMLGAMLAIAAVRPRIPVTAVIPSVENMPGANAQRPGDIVTSMCGKTVEVLNTDAEGRLILADALTYTKSLGCTHLVNAATLTGAIVVALGTNHTGLFGNDEAWRNRVLDASKAAGETMWGLPLGEEFTDLLKSPVADLANIGPRWGGAITAAAFLEQFVGDTPWVHLDIAGTAWYEKEQPHAPVGATGVGVATLVELALGLD